MTKNNGRHPGGAPTKYRDDYARMALELFRSVPFSVVKLAKVLGVQRSSVYNWMGEHPEFLDSIRQGRKIFDGQKIERSLVRRATGYRYTETTEEYDEDKSLKSVKKVKKTVPPDVAAIKHWQINMDQANWADKQRVDVDITERVEKVVLEFVSAKQQGDAP